MRLIFVWQQPIRKYFNNENFPIYGIEKYTAEGSYFIHVFRLPSTPLSCSSGFFEEIVTPAGHFSSGSRPVQSYPINLPFPVPPFYTRVSRLRMHVFKTGLCPETHCQPIHLNVCSMVYNALYICMCFTIGYHIYVQVHVYQ